MQLGKTFPRDRKWENLSLGIGNSSKYGGKIFQGDEKKRENEEGIRYLGKEIVFSFQKINSSFFLIFRPKITQRIVWSYSGGNH